jgi:NAD(P)-dependent dehydrogenase (short-subunit alcohol dehydrogenase family)
VSLLDDLDVAAKISLDVTDGASVERAVATCGDIDALVNNAALPGGGPLETMSLESFRALFETNVVGPLRLIQAFVPQWRRRQQGVIVNVSSVEGRVAGPLSGGYSASKFALEGMSETLKYELGHFGIRVVVIEPGFIAPGMKIENHIENRPSEYADLYQQWEGIDATLTGEGGRTQPEVVARAIADAIENAESPLRVPVGADAEMVLGVRRTLDDADFEATMRGVLGLTW